MLTSKEREESFRKELKELLSKHKAEFDITDDGRPYGMHSSIGMVYMDSEYDKETFECTKEYTGFRL